MSRVLLTAISALFALQAQASDSIVLTWGCDGLLAAESIQAASIVIDLGDDGSMGEVVGGGEKTKPKEDKTPEKNIRRPELELPLQIVPTGEKKRPKLPPPGTTQVPNPSPKKPDKYSIN